MFVPALLVRDVFMYVYIIITIIIIVDLPLLLSFHTDCVLVLIYFSVVYKTKSNDCQRTQIN